MKFYSCTISKVNTVLSIIAIVFNFSLSNRSMITKIEENANQSKPRLANKQVKAKSTRFMPFQKHSLQEERQHLEKIDQWIYYLPNETSVLKYINKRSSEAIIKNIVRPEPPYTSGQQGSNKDCLQLCDNSNKCENKRKNFPRLNPGKCYHLLKSQNIFWEFWNDIVHDFNYAFDFVLWDDLPKIENQFWYLILFLKSLVDVISNPFDILNLIDLYKETNTIQGMINDLLKEYRHYEKNSNLMRYSLNKINDNVVHFQKTKSALISKMNDLIEGTEEYHNNSNLMVNRIMEINTEISTIKSLVDKFADKTFAKFPEGSPDYLITIDSVEQKINNIKFPDNVIEALKKTDPKSTMQIIKEGLAKIIG